MTFRFLSPALIELTEAAEFYDEKIPGLGAEFVTEADADAAIARILEFPDAWGKISEDFRHCNFRRFPYTIIYTIEGSAGLLIVSVFHQHREPDSWRNNL